MSANIPRDVFQGSGNNSHAVTHILPIVPYRVEEVLSSEPSRLTLRGLAIDIIWGLASCYCWPSRPSCCVCNWAVVTLFILMMHQKRVKVLETFLHMGRAG